MGIEMPGKGSQDSGGVQRLSFIVNIDGLLYSSLKTSVFSVKHLNNCIFRIVFTCRCTVQTCPVEVALL